MQFLVTGATGLLGNNIVRHLLREGHSVRVLTRPPSSRPALQGLDVEMIEGDLSQPDSLRQAVSGAQAIIHAAADIHIGWHQLARQRQVNVQGTRELARLARQHDALLVHVSTVDTLAAARDGQPVSETSPDQPKVPCTYVVTKREAEQAIHQEAAEGLRAIIVNPGFMLGPWDWKPSSGRMLLAVANGWIPLAPRGGVSCCDARDVAAGVVAAAKRGRAGERYILAGENISYLEAWRLFARVTGRRPPLARMGPLVQLTAGWLGDWKARLTGQEGDVNSASLKMSSMTHYYDSGRAAAQLGYQTRPFSESAQDAWQWFRRYGYA